MKKMIYINMYNPQAIDEKIDCFMYYRDKRITLDLLNRIIFLEEGKIREFENISKSLIVFSNADSLAHLENRLSRNNNIEI